MNWKNYVKKTVFSTLGLFLLAGCATSSNTLSLEPKIVPKNPTLNATSISVSSVDNRTNKSLAEVNRNGSLVVLNSRYPRYLMQEAVENKWLHVALW